MVLLAVAMATILALSFLASQGPTAVVASNIDRKAKARAIAESALKMAIDYVNEDADWRTDKSSGVWITDASLDGGTFTLSGIDEADGDLSDDSSEVVTLSVVATYDGVTHRVSARVTPGASETTNLVLVVANASSPSAYDLTRKSLAEGWGYTVTLLDDSASQALYDAAAATASVFWIAESSFSGAVNTKLRTCSVGVMFEERLLTGDFGLTSSESLDSRYSTSMNVIDNSHAISTGLSTGSVAFATSAVTFGASDAARAAGVDALVSDGGSEIMVMAAETGATLTFGAAPARRSTFLLEDSFDISKLNAAGLTLLRATVDWAAESATPAPGTPTLLALYEFDQVTVAPTLAGRWRLDESAAPGFGGVSAGDEIDLDGSSRIESYNSTLGDVGSQPTTNNAVVTLNSTGSDKFKVDWSCYIGGDGYIGAGGNTSDVFDVNGTITGSRLVQGTNLSIPTLTAPTGMPAKTGNFMASGSSNVTINSDRHYDKFEITGSATVTISGHVTIWAEQDVKVNGSGKLVIPEGSSLTLYCGDDFDVIESGRFNADSTATGRLTIYAYGEKHVDIKGSGIMAGTVYTNDDFHITESGVFYGKVLADEEIKLEGTARIYQDLALGGFGGGGGAMPPAEDDSDLANNGTVNGGPTGGVAGQLGTAYQFDGNNDYVEIPHDDSYLMQAGTFSVWFKADTVARAQQGLFSKDSTGYDTGGHFSVFLLYDRVQVRMQSTTASYYVESASGSITAGQWYHIMFAWGEEGMVLYINGVEVDTDPYTGGLGTTSGGIGNYEPIVLGANSWTSNDLSATPLVHYFDGTLDDLRIYNERLSEAQAAEIYGGAEEPTPFLSEAIVEDTSGYGDALTLAVQDTDAVTWASGSLTFDSDTLAVSLTAADKLYDAISATGEFSVEVLLRRASPGSTSSPSRVVAYSEGAGDSNFILGQDASNYEARVRDSSTGSSGVLSPEFISATSLSASGDTHVILSYKDGEVSVYIDGVLDESNTAGGLLSNWESDHYLVFGGEYGGSDYWRGTLKRVAIYDRAFNDSQADNVYNGSDPGDGSSSGGGAGTVIWDEVD